MFTCGESAFMDGCSYVDEGLAKKKTCWRWDGFPLSVTISISFFFLAFRLSPFVLSCLVSFPFFFIFIFFPITFFPTHTYHVK